MRILVASFSYPPQADGVAMAAAGMVENFRAAGHTVDVVTSALLAGQHEPATSASQVFRFDVRWSVFSPQRASGEVSEFTQFLAQSQYDVLIFHCLDTWPAQVALGCCPAPRGLKILVSHGIDAHRVQWHWKFPWGIWSWLRRLRWTIHLPSQLKHFDKLVFLSRRNDNGRFFDARLARALCPDRVEVIPNKVDTQKLAFGAHTFRHTFLPDAGLVFLCVANYTPRKNQELAFEAFLEAAIPGATLVFIGSSLGPYGTRLQKRWEQVRTQHTGLAVHFLEGLPRETVESAILSCDVFVLTAKAETQPIVLLEAMSCGKPFLSTDTGCVADFQGGIVAKRRTGLARAMQKLAADPALRERLGADGKADVTRHYAADVVDAQWRALLDTLAGEKGLKHVV